MGNNYKISINTTGMVRVDNYYTQKQKSLFGGVYIPYYLNLLFCSKVTNSKIKYSTVNIGENLCYTLNILG